MMVLSGFNRVKRGFLNLADFFKDPRNPVRAPYYFFKGRSEVPEVDLEPGMDIDFCLTVDVEHDFGLPSTLGELSTVEGGLNNLSQFFEKREIEGTFFVSRPVLENFSDLISEISSSHEVGVHGYEHECWSGPRWWLDDDRVLDEERKRKFLDEMVDLVGDVTGEKPKSFRAPYMTVNDETLRLLDEKGFLIDSSASSQYGVFPKPYQVNDFSLFELPVSASPVPRFSFSPYPHYRFDFLITKFLEGSESGKFLDLADDILKFQKSLGISPHLVMVLHQWEFSDLDGTPTESSEYALRNNCELMDSMIRELEGKYEVHYKTLKDFRDKIV